MLAKTKLNSIEVLFSRALIDSYISHDEIVLVKNVYEKYNDMKEAIKNLKALTVHQKKFILFKKQCNHIFSNLRPGASKENYGKTNAFIRYAVCDSRKLRFTKKQEASWL